MSQKVHYIKGTLAVETRRPSFSLPPDFQSRGEYHITVLDPRDAKVLKQAHGCSNQGLEEWMKSQHGATISGTPQSLGIGRASDGSNEAYFEVIDWPEAQQWRGEQGLGPKDFHVTVGFKGSDVHGVPKDRSTIISIDRLYSIASEIDSISTQVK